MDNRLGDYLRARRSLVRPEDVGLPPGGRRRVRGLRREELALLAGISSDYYMRLEQGRDQHPSAQVLDALARVLRLDPAATAHLHRLAAPAPRRSATQAQVPPSIGWLVDRCADTPAYVHDRLTNVLAANAIATALSPNYAAGRNLIKGVFLDPAEHALRPGWEQTAANGVAGLRSLAHADDPELAALVAELSAGSERFRELWNRHDVKARTGQVVRFEHPRVGPLDLHGDKFTIAGTDDLMFVVQQAEPGSPSAEALALLAELTPVR